MCSVCPALLNDFLFLFNRLHFPSKSAFRHIASKVITFIMMLKCIYFLVVCTLSRTSAGRTEIKNLKLWVPVLGSPLISQTFRQTSLTPPRTDSKNSTAGIESGECCGAGGKNKVKKYVKMALK
jgi:hypothetical protein